MLGWIILVAWALAAFGLWRWPLFAAPRRHSPWDLE
jgi:hypothetical protein